MHAFLEMVLSNAIMATLLALAAAAVTWFCHRPALSHLFWLLVLLKLVTPPVVAVPLCSDSLPLLVHEPPTRLADTALHVPRESLTEDDDLIEPEPIPQEEEAAALTREPWVLAEPTISARPPDTVTPPFSWMGLLFGAWLTGSTIWVLLCATQIYAFQRLLRHGRLAPPELQWEAQQLADQLGVEHCPDIWLVHARISPLLWGFSSRVRLVLPVDLLAELKPDQQRTLLAHELAHARRRDHWVRWLEVLVTAIYWWHPVVWWARQQLQHAEEQCCDIWVVWLLPRAAKAYARTLLQTVSFLDARMALPPVASGAGHLHHLKRRLSMITREPCCPRLSLPVLLGAIALGALALSFTPQLLKAQNLDEPAAVTLDDDEPQSAALDDDDEEQEGGRSGSDRSSTDLERRMRQLEQKMDKVLQALSQRGGSGVREGEQNRAEAERKARDEARRARDEVRRAQEEARRAQQSARREMEQARRQIEVEVRRQKQQAENAVAEAKDKARQEAKSATKEQKQTRTRIVIDGKEINRDMLKEQIEKRIHEAINPERMRDLQKQIDEVVHQSLNPERMRDLDKRIEEMVNRTVNPQRLEALGRQIEQAVNQSLNSQQREQSRDSARNRGEGSRSSSSGSSSSSSSRSSSGNRDLERRMNQLEEKMERVLKALESSRKN
jgi:beta-lactamase regulating signal transducer with metallopeptidase domain